jgi:YVTN family beta-propeller protein
VAVNAVTNKVYVANNQSGNVTVIDGATNSATTVAAGSGPCAVAVNTVTNKVYVANYGSAYGSANVTVIDGATNSATAVAAGTCPRAVAVNPVTNKVYVANAGSDNVTVIDGATNSATTVAAGSGPYAVAVNPVTNKVYVANYGSNSVTVIGDAAPLSLSISRSPSKSSVTYKRKKKVAKFTLSATLSDASGRVAGAVVWLQKSSNGKKWSNLYKLKTNASGKASKAFSVKKKGTTYYRWSVPATAWDKAGLTGKQKVVVK